MKADKTTFHDFSSATIKAQGKVIGWGANENYFLTKRSTTTEEDRAFMTRLRNPQTLGVWLADAEEPHALNEEFNNALKPQYIYGTSDPFFSSLSLSISLHGLTKLQPAQLRDKINSWNDTHIEESVKHLRDDFKRTQTVTGHVIDLNEQKSTVSIAHSLPGFTDPWHSDFYDPKDGKIRTIAVRGTSNNGTYIALNGTNEEGAFKPTEYGQVGSGLLVFKRSGWQKFMHKAPNLPRNGADRWRYNIIRGTLITEEPSPA